MRWILLFCVLAALEGVRAAEVALVDNGTARCRVSVRPDASYAERFGALT